MTTWVFIAVVYGYGHWYPIAIEDFRSLASCEQFGKNVEVKWKTTQYICIEKKP